MCAGGCFCSVKTKRRSEEELKNGGKSEERRRGCPCCLFTPASYLFAIGGVVTFDPGAGGAQQRCQL